jgi:plastocyanin
LKSTDLDSAAMSSRQRLTFAAIAVAIAVIAIVVAVAGGGSDDGSGTNASAPATATATATASAEATATAETGGAKAEPQGTRIVVKGGQPVGGVQKIKVSQGDDIVFSVKSDTADEVHVHGFDFHKDVEAGGTVRFDFPAKITGVFEVELEAAKVQLAQLTVEP